MERLQVEVATKERRRTNQPNGDGEEVIVANARGVGKVTMLWEVFSAALSHILSEKAVLLLTRRSWMTTPSRR